MVANLASLFDILWGDAIVTRCYGFIDEAVGDYVGRMQSYFLVEGTHVCGGELNVN